MRTHSVAARVVAHVAVAVGLLAASMPALSDTFVVNDGGYSVDVAPGNGVCADAGGKCTLNAAIMEGNFRAGSHTITFASTVTMVTLNGSLAQMRAPYTVIGDPVNRTILNGFNGTNHFPCFDLVDSGDLATGHDQTGANGSTIGNMVINGCNGHGISANGHGWTFINNYIGTDPTGAAAVPNSQHGISVSSSRKYSQETSQFLIDLAAQIPAQPLSSADASNFAAQLTTVLANVQLGPVLITGNVISGNTQNGIEIFSENIAGVIVTGNLIGTDPTGNLNVGNGQNGVHFVGSPFANIIVGNLISANGANGIQNDAGKVALPNFIMANRIGLTATNPALSLGNGLSGIVTDTAPEDAIPHFNPTMISLIIGPGNVISGNNGVNNNAFPDVFGSDNGGIVITGNSKGVKILNNTIGIGEFPPGVPLATKSYGNAGDGIIITVPDVTVDGNVVSANGRHGVVIRGSTVTGTKLTNNFIGVHPLLPGDLTIGNVVDGVHINAASTSVIGGSGGADPNTIAGNGRNGVKIRNGNANNGWANLLQRNRIYANSKNGLTPGVGIDLDFLENASNPLHGEFLGLSYAEFDQAQPVICTGAGGEPAACAGFQPASSSGGNTSADWTIATHGPATFRMEFFSINAASVNAATTMTYIGEQMVTTDITGTPTGAGCTAGRCSASIAAGTGGSRIVMTANDVTQITNVPGGGWLQFGKCIVFANCFVNNTSEFSNVATPLIGTTTAVTVVTPQGSGNATPTATSVFGQPVQVTVTVTAAGGGAAPTGSVTVNAGGSSCPATLGSPVNMTSSGSCTLTPNLASSASAYTVSASYAATAGFTASASSGGGNGSLTVNKAATTTTITADTPDPSTVNAPYSVSATVAVTGAGAGTPSGTVTVSDGTSNCVITLPATSCNLVSTTTGGKTLVATYSGDSNFATSLSAGVAHGVDPPVGIVTTTAVTVVTPQGSGNATSTASSVFGQPVAVTVTVTAASGGAAPTGTVTITAGAGSCPATLGSPVNMTATGTCTLAPNPAVAVSAYSVTAAYPGTATFAGSASSGGGNGSLTVNKATTTTTIGTHTPNPSDVNAPIAVTVTVAVNGPGAGTPSGTITVSDGISNCTITLPATSCNLTPTTSGGKTLTATYNGDASFSVSAASGVSHTVNAVGGIATTTVVTVVTPQGSGNATSTASSVFGQPVTVTVTVTAASGGAAPTGSITVNAGASSCPATLGSPVNMTATGSCVLTPAPAFAASAYSITAAYAGNATFSASSSSGGGNGSLTVGKASTTTAIGTHTPNPSNVNSPIAVTATVAITAPGSATPSGTITVSDGTSNCTITLPATSCNLTPTTSGPKTLTATYNGDANLNASAPSPGVAHTVNPAAAIGTTTVVTVVNPQGSGNATSTATGVFGQPVAVTVTVTAASGGAAPTGSVTVNAGGSSCPVTLGSPVGMTSSGSCTLAPNPAAAASAYAVTGNYAGTATFAASASSGAGNGSLTVNKAATTTTIGTHTPNPSDVNTPIAVTAGVAVTAPGSGTPTGTITISDGTSNCVITLPATSCNLTPTTSGSKNLVATYSGDTNFQGGASAGVAHTVNPAGLIGTTTVVTVVNPQGSGNATSTASSVFGQSVAVTVTVTAASGGAAPTGSVTVSAGASSCPLTLGSPVGMTASGSCTLAPNPAAAASAYAVTASYAGTATLAASASSGAGNGSLTVNKATTTVAIGTHTPDPANVGSPVTVTATVAITAPGSGTPSGTITISDGTVSCVITLPATSCSATPTTSGPKTVTATYSGDTNFSGSVSPGVVQTVNAVQAFVGPTVAPGVTGSVTLSGGGPNCSLSNPAFIGVVPPPPPGVSFPFGLFTFTAVGCTAGSTITVQIVYSQALPAGTQYWKYGPTPGGGQNALDHWYTLPGATVNGTTATFTITDGQIGDDDLIANTVIVDQGGPGVPPTPAAAAQIPTLNEMTLALLALLIAGWAWVSLRRRVA